MKFIIPLNPVTKKNHGRIARRKTKEGNLVPFFLPSEAYEKYKKQCKNYIPVYRQLPINKPINLKCSFYMGTRRKCDITNLLQAICDILVDYNIIEDDNYSIVSSIDGTRVYYDKENPRTEVEITFMEDKNEV